jgi:hypothetical protein
LVPLKITDRNEVPSENIHAGTLILTDISGGNLEKTYFLGIICQTNKRLPKYMQ